MDARKVGRRWADTARRDLGVVVFPWAVSRLLVALAYLVAWLAADRFDVEDPPLTDGLFAWDGGWYEEIAEHGYDSLPEQALRFFPLYPISGRLLGFLAAGRSWIALVLLANIGALVAAMLIRRLTFDLTGDARAAIRSAWLLLLAPASFVLVWAYSEAVFLVAAVGALIALQRRAWWPMAGLGAVAALTRPVGVLLALAAVVGVLGFDRGRRRAATTGSSISRGAAVAGPILGLGAYLLWAELSVGDWRAPMDAQTPLRGEAAVPLVPLWSGLADVLDGRTSALLHLGSTAVFAGLVVVAFLRLPVAQAVFAAATFLVATSAERLTSLERYALSAVPIVVAAAIILRRPGAERAVLSLSGSAMVGLAVLAWLGAYTP